MGTKGTPQAVSRLGAWQGPQRLPGVTMQSPPSQLCAKASSGCHAWCCQLRPRALEARPEKAARGGTGPSAASLQGAAGTVITIVTAVITISRPQGKPALPCPASGRPGEDTVARDRNAGRGSPLAWGELHGSFCSNPTRFVALGKTLSGHLFLSAQLRHIPGGVPTGV